MLKYVNAFNVLEGSIVSLYLMVRKNTLNSKSKSLIKTSESTIFQNKVLFGKWSDK